MRKAAIVTLYDNINIGNKLQNYAVQEILKKYFDVVDTLSYKEASKLYNDMGWKGRLVAKLGFPKKVADKKRAIQTRRKKFQDFSMKYLSVKSSLHYTEYTSAFSKKYDYFVAGSDQVWHNWSNTVEELEYFFLSFVPKDKRVCISPSFGFEVVPEEFKDYYITGLNGFNNLSCREKNAVDIIKKLVNVDPKLLIDPTMRLSTADWDRISRAPSYEVPEKYMLVYCLGGMNEAVFNDIKDFSKEKKLKVIDIYNLNYPHYYSTSPEEFLFLIKNASYVYTNSFHGCVFSLLYHKPVLLVNRLDEEGEKMKGRLDTLFSTFLIKDNPLYPDFHLVDQILESQRIKMDQYLDKCFCNKG